MTIETVRTTAFRLSDEHFGEVFAYRAGARFATAWRGLEDWWRSRPSVGEDKYLPWSIASAITGAMFPNFRCVLWLNAFSLTGCLAV